MLSRIEKAREFRAMLDATRYAVQRLIRIDDLKEEELEDMIDIYESWESLIGKFSKKGTYIKYNGKLYKVIKGITHQEDWKPNEVLSEYDPIFPDEVIAEWEQRYGHNLYKIGEKVLWEDKVYELIVGDDKNEGGAYNPSVAPTHWKLIP